MVLIAVVLRIGKNNYGNGITENGVEITPEVAHLLALIKSFDDDHEVVLYLEKENYGVGKMVDSFPVLDVDSNEMYNRPCRFINVRNGNIVYQLQIIYNRDMKIIRVSIQGSIDL